MMKLAGDMSRWIVVSMSVLLAVSCAGPAESPVPPGIPNPTSDASLDYALTLQPSGDSAYLASLTLTWRTANGVGFGVESADVAMHDAQQRQVFRAIHGAAELAHFWGTNRVLAFGRESREYTVVFSAPVPYVRATVTSMIVDSFDHRRTLQLALTRDGLGTTAN